MGNFILQTTKLLLKLDEQKISENISHAKERKAELVAEAPDSRAKYLTNNRMDSGVNKRRLK